MHFVFIRATTSASTALQLTNTGNLICFSASVLLWQVCLCLKFEDRFIAFVFFAKKALRILLTILVYSKTIFPLVVGR